MSIFEQQCRFMVLGGQKNGGSVEQALKYLDHLDEELNEIYKAAKATNIVGIVDGLVDSIVVASGALISLLGADGAQQAWDAVMDANMAKVDGRHGPVRWRDDGQIGKPAGWHGPELELAKIIERTGIAEQFMQAVATNEP